MIRDTQGMFGVFSDSLPDGWGRLLVDRSLGAGGIAPERVEELSRLAIVGPEGMGALRYEPTSCRQDERSIEDFDAFARACRAVLADHDVADLVTVGVEFGLSKRAASAIAKDVKRLCTGLLERVRRHLEA